MERLRKFLSLSPSERSLLFKAFTLLWGIRLGLWLLSFQTLRRLLARVTDFSKAASHPDSPSPERYGWAVGVASRYVPKATCLSQALAAQVLLERQGHASQLHIGVVQDEKKELRAHAWLWCQGKVVIGESRLERYTPLLVSEGNRL